MPQEFFFLFPFVVHTIYVYDFPEVPSHQGYIKVGYTERNVETRVYEQTHTSGLRPRILLKESAMRKDGTCFTDKEVHLLLRSRGFKQMFAGEDNNEWFACSVNDVMSAVLQLRDGIVSAENRTATFSMRPEQVRAVQNTIAYFESAKKEEPTKAPKFLWNAKMRFGKTFATYQLCKKMNFKHVLVLTFKPAVESAWSEDLTTHVDFEGWQFVSNKDAHNNSLNIDKQFELADKTRSIVVFGSFQDLLGTNDNGGIKTKNEFIHTTNWDLVVFDEYHFGAWRENAKKLFENPDDEENADFDVEKYKRDEADNAYNETFLPITTGYYLYLSGTPFRAINSGEFIEEQIFNWTYSDEQKAKTKWIGSGNPYLALPRMVMLTYKIPESIRQVALQGEFDEFDLNVFFSAKGKGADAKFVYENEVQQWLNLIRGAFLPSSIDDLKLGQDKRPPMPFSDTRLLNVLSHTLWFLPNVASCEAMANLLNQKQNAFYNQAYRINVCAGTKAGIGLDALKPVQDSMGNPLQTRTITLSCGKLTTGVTIRPWTGIFMLRNLKSPETYFQAAFRVQSPWEIIDDNANKQIIKHECYIFDFALDRALRQISDYACRLNVDEGDPEKKVADFISFLPVLAYDGSAMKEIDAQDILDITMAGTSATLLARRWESALLVNVDNDTLERLRNNKEALDALMRIEGFRALNKDIETIINKSNAVKKAKAETEKLTDKEKKELTQEEKEYKSLRKQIQEKLIKFATRVPVFMYLTDYREKCLKDVITQLEPGLFKKVTGLDVKDFNLLCSIGVFNASLMNDAIFKFKRYEDASLMYTGLDKHHDDEVGGWDTVIKKEEYKKLFYNQQATLNLETPKQTVADIAVATTAENKGGTAKEKQKYIADTTMNNVSQSKTANRTVTTNDDLPVTNNVTTTKHSNAVGSPTANDTTRTASCTTETPQVDFTKLTVGTVVLHKVFGEGTITRVDSAGKYIRVRFTVGEKNFGNYAFDQGFLTLK